MDVAKMYPEDGSLGYEGEIKNGKPYGQGKAYYSDGTVKLEGRFGLKGLLEGKLYNPNGTIRFEGTFEVNHSYGPNWPVVGTLYDEHGKLIYEGKIRFTRSGTGYPTIIEPKEFCTSEYQMPVMPFMRADESSMEK